METDPYDTGESILDATSIIQVDIRCLGEKKGKPSIRHGLNFKSVTKNMPRHVRYATKGGEENESRNSMLLLQKYRSELLVKAEKMNVGN